MHKHHIWPCCWALAPGLLQSRHQDQRPHAHAAAGQLGALRHCSQAPGVGFYAHTCVRCIQIQLRGRGPDGGPLLCAGENNVNGFGLEFYIETPANEIAETIHDVKKSWQFQLLYTVSQLAAGATRSRLSLCTRPASPRHPASMCQRTALAQTCCRLSTLARAGRQDTATSAQSWRT